MFEWIVVELPVWYELDWSAELEELWRMIWWMDCNSFGNGIVAKVNWWESNKRCSSKEDPFTVSLSCIRLNIGNISNAIFKCVRVWINNLLGYSVGTDIHWRSFSLLLVSGFRICLFRVLFITLYNICMYLLYLKVFSILVYLLYMYS